MRQLVQEGKSIIMISSEMPEILGMCDRVIVLHEGKKMGELKESGNYSGTNHGLCIRRENCLLNFSQVKFWILLNRESFFVFILIVAVLAILSPAFISPPNLMNIAKQISINGILAVGMTFVIISGEI